MKKSNNKKYISTITELQQSKHYRNSFSYNYKNEREEENYDDSLTIPDQAMSIRQILADYTIGRDNNVLARNPQYSNTDDFDNIDPTSDPSFDLADMTELQEQIELNRIRANEARAKGQKPTVTDTEKAPERSGEATDVDETGGESPTA